MPDEKITVMVSQEELKAFLDEFPTLRKDMRQRMESFVDATKGHNEFEITKAIRKKLRVLTNLYHRWKRL